MIDEARAAQTQDSIYDATQQWPPVVGMVNCFLQVGYKVSAMVTEQTVV